MKKSYDCIWSPFDDQGKPNKENFNEPFLLEPPSTIMIEGDMFDLKVEDFTRLQVLGVVAHLQRHHFVIKTRQSREYVHDFMIYDQHTEQKDRTQRGEAWVASGEVRDRLSDRDWRYYPGWVDEDLMSENNTFGNKHDREMAMKWPLPNLEIVYEGE